MKHTLRAPNSVRISIHIRHYAIFNTSDAASKLEIENADQRKMNELKQLRDSLDSSLACIVYIATGKSGVILNLFQVPVASILFEISLELQPSLEIISNFSSSINCSAYSISRDESTIMYDDPNRISDHGIFGSGNLLIILFYTPMILLL